MFTGRPDIVLTLIGSALLFGTLGYLFSNRIPYQRFRGNCMSNGAKDMQTAIWTHCIFKGNAPAQYASWFDFIRSPVKDGVTIRASTPDDWEGNRMTTPEYAKKIELLTMYLRGKQVGRKYAFMEAGNIAWDCGEKILADRLYTMGKEITESDYEWEES